MDVTTFISTTASFLGAATLFRHLIAPHQQHLLDAITYATDLPARYYPLLSIATGSTIGLAIGSLVALYQHDWRYIPLGVLLTLTGSAETLHPRDT